MSQLDFETEMRNRLRSIEEKVDFLISKMGYSESSSGDSEYSAGGFSRSEHDLSDVIALVRQNKKIAAIKLYRQKWGVGLREAKQAVDTLASSM